MAKWYADALNVVQPEHVCYLLDKSDDYQQNRDRVALLVQEGFGYYDTYRKWQPTLFWLSSAFATANAWMLWKRGVNKRQPESIVMYSTGLIGASIMAFIFNPYQATSPAQAAKVANKRTTTAPSITSPEIPSGSTRSAPQNTDAGFIQWLDKKVSVAKEKNPSYADKAITRFVSVPGIDAQWKNASALTKSLILCKDT